VARNLAPQVAMLASTVLQPGDQVDLTAQPEDRSLIQFDVHPFSRPSPESTKDVKPAVPDRGPRCHAKLARDATGAAVEVTRDRAVPAKWVGREPVFPWEGKV
jgi:hypothetical protein